MANKKNYQLYIIIAIIIIFAGGIFYLMFMLFGPSSKPVSSEKDNSLEIRTDIYNKIISPQDYGKAVSPDEPGFGRENPFAPYK